MDGACLSVLSRMPPHESHGLDNAGRAIAEAPRKDDDAFPSKQEAAPNDRTGFGELSDIGSWLRPSTYHALATV